VKKSLSSETANWITVCCKKQFYTDKKNRQGNSLPNIPLSQSQEELNTPIENISFLARQIRKENNTLVEDHIFSAEPTKKFFELILSEGKKMQLFSFTEIKNIKIVAHYKPYILNHFQHQR